eukprot:TRINITY_DN12319_c0_g1_i1.p1 TRINITY_DN12319_c0_g1~~TRINITY_DN12319_c0_g1_i1.p1  ORF type:complete len:467 (+),score=81.56 TRINITY_DN12319_c0_g1_i1:139-1401(+)
MLDAINHEQHDLDDLHIIIDNKKYDVTKWQTYHPGGRLILQQYNNRDASDPFYAFHEQASIDKLKSMKSVDVPETEVDETTKNFRLLREKLKSEGWFENQYLWYTYKMGTTYLLFLMGFIFPLYFNQWLLGAIALGVFYQQAGWLGHDLCHHQVFKNRKVNNFFAYLTGNTLAGFSVNWWKDRHNTHHAITNVLESDPDIDNLPLFSWTEKELDRVLAFPLARYLIPYQHLYFPIFTPFLKLIWCLQSFFFLSDQTTQNKSYYKSITAEKYTLALHWLMVASFLYCIPSGYRILAFMISEGIGGAGIALVVFMNHYACEKLSEDEYDENHSFITLQLSSTRNIHPGLITDWLCGGLNYQVEHHLFPTVPRNKLNALKPIVEKYCKDNNLPYQSESFIDCFTLIETQLKSVADAYVASKQQ